MAILPVRLYTDKILHQPCEVITDFSNLEELAQSMLLTMIHYRGVGLAANQIGVNKQLAALHIENKSKYLILANIKVLRYTKESTVELEGCLSCPGISVPMKRAKAVEIEAQKLNGEKIELQFTDYDARILQHEWDHLNGRLISDYLRKMV